MNFQPPDSLRTLLCNSRRWKITPTIYNLAWEQSENDAALLVSISRGEQREGGKRAISCPQLGADEMVAYAITVVFEPARRSIPAKKKSNAWSE